MKIIEKKEIKDMFSSYKAALGLFFGAIIPYLLKWRGVEPFSYLYLVMMIMFLCQHL